jgi:hypothetical protein
MASKAALKKATYICRLCFNDTALPATCQFGKPRGFDVRGEGRDRYCGTCGEPQWLERVKL